MLITTCVGCGGGGGDSATQPSAAPQQTTTPQPKAVLIEAYGDSTIYGMTEVNNVQVRAAMPAPAVLQSLLQAKFGTNVTVSNHGVSGTTAANLLGGDGKNLPWAQQMAQSKAQIVLFNFGINDSKVAAGEPVDAFRSNEMELVRIAKAAGKTVVIETANPVSDPICMALPSYVAATLDVARTWDIPVINQYAYLSSMDWRSLMSDPQGMHPTQAGYQVKAQYEFDILAPVVQDLLSR